MANKPSTFSSAASANVFSPMHREFLRAEWLDSLRLTEFIELRGYYAKLGNAGNVGKARGKQRYSRYKRLSQ